MLMKWNGCNMYNRSNHQISPNKLFVIEQIEGVWKQLTSDSLPVSELATWHIMDLESLKFRLQAKLITE